LIPSLRIDNQFYSAIFCNKHAVFSFHFFQSGVRHHKLPCDSKVRRIFASICSWQMVKFHSVDIISGPCTQLPVDVPISKVTDHGKLLTLVINTYLVAIMKRPSKINYIWYTEIGELDSSGMESIHNGRQAPIIQASAFYVEGHNQTNHPRYMRIGVISLRP